MKAFTFEVKVSTYYQVKTIAENKSQAMENIRFDHDSRMIINDSEGDIGIHEEIEDLEIDDFEIVSLFGTEELQEV